MERLVGVADLKCIGHICRKEEANLTVKSVCVCHLLTKLLIPLLSVEVKGRLNSRLVVTL